MTGGVLLSMRSSWKETLSVAFQSLRRINFTYLEDFAFSNFDPQLSFSGVMTGATPLVNSCRYLKLGKFVWVHFDIQVTLGGVASNTIFIKLPQEIAASAGYQMLPVAINNAVNAEPGTAIVIEGERTLNIYRGSLVNYALGATRLISNGFIEVR